MNYRKTLRKVMIYRRGFENVLPFEEVVLMGFRL